MTTVLPPLVARLPDGVTRAILPNPFGAHTVNCYLLADPPVTVIDPGTLQSGSLGRLSALLAKDGLRLDDVEQVVVTHAHPDHFGAAGAVAARSGARIICGRPEIAALIGRGDDSPDSDLLARLGVPPVSLPLLVKRPALDRLVRWPDPAAVVGVDHGETIVAGGRRLNASVTPGHRAGHLSLWDADGRILFSGDHLLGRIVPATGLAVDRTVPAGRRPSLLEYLDSLRCFEQLDARVLLPGHGQPFTGMEILAARLRAGSAERAETILSLLADGAATPYELTQRLLWQPAGFRLLLGIGHVAGHLDLLESAGRVATETTGGVTRYRRVSDR